MAEAQFTRAASLDLEEIIQYIGEDSLAAAEKLADQIRSRCQLLADNPRMGQRRDEFGINGLKSFHVGNYVIYLQPSGDGVNVIRVLHGARDHGRLL